MVEIVEISCSNCDYSKEFQLGVGMVYHSFDNVWDVIPSRRRLEIKEILQNHKVVEGDFSHRLYHCHNCNELYERFYYKTTSNEEKTYETKFMCRLCGTELVPVEVLETDENEEDILLIESLPCPKCKEKSLAIGDTITLWD